MTAGGGATVGVAYRTALASWIESRPPDLECVELNAEDFYRGGLGHVPSLATSYPLLVHGSRLSLGTPGPLHPVELERFSAVVAVARPRWISEHLGFCRSAEVDLAHVNPLRLTADTLKVFAAHCREVIARCGTPLLIENIAAHLRLPGTLSETEFLNRVCDETGCGLLLDLSSLLVNARIHAFDPGDWLHGLDPRHIVQLHVGAYAGPGRPWIQEDLWDLVEEVTASAPVRAVILERDASFPSIAELEDELRRARRLARGQGAVDSSAPPS